MSPSQRYPARRDLLRSVALVPALTLGTAGVARASSSLMRPEIRLLSDGVVMDSQGVVHAVAPGRPVPVVPGTRLVALGAEDEVLGGSDLRDRHAATVQRQRQLVAAAHLPSGAHEDMLRRALEDLLCLTGPTLGARTDEPASRPPQVFPRGAVIAGPVGMWRYTWPRDASFACVALARVGLEQEALDILAYLAYLARDDGGFEARYGWDGRVPDDRPAQSDGAGWFLWAAGRLASDGVGTEMLREVAGAALARSAAWLLSLTEGPSGVPAASPDYWEVEERRLTLATGAAVLLGLEAAAALAGHGVLNEPGAAGSEVAASTEALAQGAHRLRARLEAAFSPGWGRHAGDHDVDAAIALVGPPFTDSLEGSVTVRQRAAGRMLREGGGLAPGSSWRRDGVSWTPESALMAWSARAMGLDEEADWLMGWLEAHRTASGSLPEKVGPRGWPAGPAPLAWTCALVLLAAGEENQGTV